MILGDMEYKINVDGETIERLTLTREQYSTQKSRDEIRMNFAKKHGIHPRGVRLVPVEGEYIYVTDMKTGETNKVTRP